MCLILIAWRTHPEFPLVLAANRDEFHARPSAAAAPWEEDARVLGGRDLEAGGSWLAARDDGRFAAVTNVREPGAAKGPRSRGHLVSDFLLGDAAPGAYAEAIDGAQFSGFNLLLGHGGELWYRSNRDPEPRRLEPGLYGLSNHLLDTPWPKLVTAKAGFRTALSQLPDPERCFRILADRETVPDRDLPATGLTPEWERLLSAVFVQSEAYGTRAGTVLLRGADGTVRLEERRFGPDGGLVGTDRFLGREGLPWQPGNPLDK
jgi:uncharacterized protein with NRDE domain